MSHKRKQDRQRIVAKLDDLIRRYKYDARSWWPNFVFHYTTLENAISILKRGSLYSRDKVVSRGLLGSDSASSSVLARTSDTYKNYARLYFRPKTPTQYSNEGIRPRDALVLAAHCPIPVFLLFNSRDVLTRASTQFSRGSLAGYSPGSVGTTASFFEKLPFNKIYHNSWLEEDQKREIIASRHAEVIVPDHLDLDPLRFIWCRSEAEKETLLSLLRGPQRNQWADRVFHGKKYDLFFSRWSYLDQVALDENGARFRFNRNTKTPGPFDLEVVVKHHATGKTSRARREDFSADHSVSLNFKNPITNYTIELRLDGCLAYRCEREEIPDLF